MVELCSRAPRRFGGVGECFADRSVETVHPYVECLEGVDEVGSAVAAQNEGTHELEGEDTGEVLPCLASDMRLPLGSYL